MKLITATLLLFESLVLSAPSPDAQPPYLRMDYGPALFWTYQIAPGNIAQRASPYGSTTVRAV